MLVQKFQTIVLLLTVFLNTSCASNLISKGNVYLIPEDYVGFVVIVFADENGIVPHTERSRKVYEIPMSGILKVNEEEPEQVKENEYYYLDKKGSRTKLNYLDFEGEAVRDAIGRSADMDYSKDEISCTNDYVRRTSINGKDISYRAFLVGKKKDINLSGMRLKDLNLLEMKLEEMLLKAD